MCTSWARALRSRLCNWQRQATHYAGQGRQAGEVHIAHCSRYVAHALHAAGHDNRVVAHHD